MGAPESLTLIRTYARYRQIDAVSVRLYRTGSLWSIQTTLWTSRRSLRHLLCCHVYHATSPGSHTQAVHPVGHCHDQMEGATMICFERAHLDKWLDECVKASKPKIKGTREVYSRIGKQSQVPSIISSGPSISSTTQVSCAQQYATDHLQ
jgi:hypothetical protein